MKCKTLAALEGPVIYSRFLDKLITGINVHYFKPKCAPAPLCCAASRPTGECFAVVVPRAALAPEGDDGPSTRHSSILS